MPALSNTANENIRVITLHHYYYWDADRGQWILHETSTQGPEHVSDAPADVGNTVGNKLVEMIDSGILKIAGVLLGLGVFMFIIMPFINWLVQYSRLLDWMK